MKALCKSRIFSVVHGSIARGDVTSKSDIDIFVPQFSSSFEIENALEKSFFPIKRRILVQATPTYSLKGYIEIDNCSCVSFALCNLRKIEREFYGFSGENTLEMLMREKRVPGVNKRLMLVEPFSKGHVESNIIGRIEEVAKILKISAETVRNRTIALLRRDKVGRTGVFVQRVLRPEETFEFVLKKLSSQNPAVRRRLRS
jgi:predicted nucleotidyltransferase